MEDLINRLADPHLVVLIQRACGVRSVAEGAATEGDAGGEGQDSGEHLTVDTPCPPATNGTNAADGQAGIRHRTNQQNGHAQYDQNTNNTSQHTNGHVAGLDPHSTTRPLNQDGVTPNDCFTVNNWFLHTIFSLGAELGNESFYIIFYPYFFWNIDGWMARRVCWFWCLFMYAGQTAKDVIKWPRPAAPPVFRLEKKYAFEYGMPSTHAMVGVGLPFLTYYLTYNRYEFNWAVGLFGTCLWCAVVCFSRLYLGMHSVLDVLAGIAFAVVLLPIWITVMDPLDHFFLTHPMAPYVAILVPLLMCLMYPTLEQWSTARGDTSLVIGVGAGVAISHWINYQYGLMGMQMVPHPYEIPELTLPLFSEHLTRMAVGGSLALITRAMMKFTTYRLSCKYWGLDHKDPLAKQQLCVELPVKFITYVVLSLTVIVLTPVLFRRMDIGRASFYTEL